MKNLSCRHAIALGLIFLGACSSTSTPVTGAGDGTTPAAEAGATEDAAASTTPLDAGAGPTDSAAPATDSASPTLPTTDAGCLAYAAAQQVCGFNSDGNVCKFSASCTAGGDVDQCKINCEMESTITCFAPADAQCLLDAVKAKSCTALAACKWKL